MDVTKVDGITPPGTGRGKKETKGRSGAAGNPEDDSTEERTPLEERPGAVSVSGLSAAILTPEVHRVIDSLIRELDRLRRELELARGRETYLKDVVDNHPFLPVLNRRAFVRELGQVLAHSEHLQTPVSLLCLHLPNGEEVRQRHGRQVLDQALIHICNVLKGQLHPTDIVGSLGGNDFGIILLLGDEASAAGKGGAVVQAIGLHPFRWQGENIPLNAVTSTRILETGRSPEEMLAKVDHDMMAGW